MFKNYIYGSIFADHIKAYISERRTAGFLFNNQAYWLHRFDRFCQERQVNQSILTKEIFEQWACALDNETKCTQSNRLQALRGFSVYLNTIGNASYIPNVLTRPEKTIPYLMSNEDIQAFFEAADSYLPRVTTTEFHRLAVEYRVIFRLIYSCGLRISEACNLRATSFDADVGNIAIIHSKGDKDRLVYLADDMCDLLKGYITWLREDACCISEWLFPGRDPSKHVHRTLIDRKFNDFWSATKTATVCEKKPTVHCLRHAFVIRRMNRWMIDDTVNLNSMMPYLSSYLGHRGPIESFYYYHQIEEAFAVIRSKDTITKQVLPEVMSI